MPESVIKYKVFVASPSDVADERASIDEVISELNQTYGVSKNIVLELLKWETHSAPGVSKSDSQSIINSDIGQDYDLFIGILWTKFGTPTKNANSGTEEEFQIAYDRFKESPGSIQILFYFKTSPPSSLSDIDHIQLGKIQEFKSSLGEKATLYWEYSSIGELQKFLRIHIPKRIDQLIKEQNIPVAKDSHYDDTQTNTTEELGIFDYQEIIEESFANSTRSVERIADSVTWIGEEINKKTKEANRLTGNQDVAKKVLRDYFKRTAKILNDFAERINPDINIFITNFEEGADAISKIINIRRNDFEEDDQDDFDQTFQALLIMDEGISSSLDGVRDFLNAVRGLPRMEKEMNRARKNVESKLDLLINKMEISLALSKELQKELK